MSEVVDILGSGPGTWRERLDYVVETMKEVSRHTDPDAMVRAYSERMRVLRDRRMISLTRRGMEPPRFLIARDSDRDEQVNVWTERDRLPVMEGGLLGELAYGNEARIVNDLDLPDSDPAAELLSGYRSLVALPVFDGGEALNVVVFLGRENETFEPHLLPQMVLISNLFGRATHNLVLSDQVRRAYEAVDRELKEIADIQRSLLPPALPEIPSLDLAAFYRPATRAGGDYYDFFPMADGEWGILIADVSGHGSPAAVEMAITRTLAHERAREPVAPGEMLCYVNENLAARYSSVRVGFVTAFFGMYHPEARTLRYAIAGHPPPRLKRCSDGSLFTLTGGGGPPLGILADHRYREDGRDLIPGDQMILYTDGITEAFNPRDEMFGAERLDRTLENCGINAESLIADVLGHLDTFREGRELSDDLTLLVARVT